MSSPAVSRRIGGATASVGVAERVAGEALIAVVNRADEAMYEVKRSGKNRTVLSQAGAA